VPYQTFACSDGYIIVASGNDGQYQKFVEVGGRPDLATHERYATNPLRVQHRDELVPILAEMVAKQTRAFWIEQLEAVGVPCGPINNLDDVYKNPQVLARELVMEVPHPTAGSTKLVRSPMKMSRTPTDVAVAPPLLGQHTDDILREVLGHSDAEIATLRAQGVVMHTPLNAEITRLYRLDGDSDSQPLELVSAAGLTRAMVLEFRRKPEQAVPRHWDNCAAWPTTCRSNWNCRHRP
jgi:hypothetical protein